MLQTTTADGIKPAKEIRALAFSLASDIERSTQFGNLLRDARWLAWRKRVVVLKERFAKQWFERGKEQRNSPRTLNK